MCGDKGIVEFLRTHGPTSENDLALINSENKNVPYIPHSNDVEKLDIRNGNKDSVTSVYFAKGDERQAVRKFINENYEFVRECMEGRNPSLRRRFNGIIGQVFAEEWRKRNRIQYG